MSNSLSNEAIATNTTAADAFLTLSNVYLASIERLSALNLKTAREAVKDCAAATQSLSGASAANDFNKLLPQLGQPMWEKALTQSRSTYEIIAKTHEEMSNVIKGQLAQPQMASAGLAGWNAMSDVFAKGVQQITASAAESVAAVTTNAGKAT